MKKKFFKKEHSNKELLLKTTLELENIVVILDKIHSGFDDNDLDKIALSALLFFSEKKIIDRLEKLNLELYKKLGELIGKNKLDSRIKKIKKSAPEYYKVKLNLTEDEIKEEILKHIILYMYTLPEEDED